MHIQVSDIVVKKNLLYRISYQSITKSSYRKNAIFFFCNFPIRNILQSMAGKNWYMRDNSHVRPCLHERIVFVFCNCTCDPRFLYPNYRVFSCGRLSNVLCRIKQGSTINPMCQVNDGIEDTEHFLLLCNSFQEQRHTLLAGVNDVLAAYEYSVSSNSDMLEILLYGSKHLSLEANNLILRLTIKYIFETERFA